MHTTPIGGMFQGAPTHTPVLIKLASLLILSSGPSCTGRKCWKGPFVRCHASGREGTWYQFAVPGSSVSAAPVQLALRRARSSLRFHVLSRASGQNHCAILSKDPKAQRVGLQEIRKDNSLFRVFWAPFPVDFPVTKPFAKPPKAPPLGKFRIV